MNVRPLVASPMPTIILTVAYLYFVKIAGPRWMKHKPAYSLRKLMIIYNFLMVAVSTYLLVHLDLIFFIYEVTSLKCYNTNLFHRFFVCLQSKVR